MILACPPGHAFAGRTVTLDELREESLIVMQEGAGVRQIVEDELRRARDAAARSRRAPRAGAAGVGAERRAGRLRRVRSSRARPSRPSWRRARSLPLASRGSTPLARSRSPARPAARPRGPPTGSSSSRAAASSDRPLGARAPERGARAPRCPTAVPLRRRASRRGLVDCRPTPNPAKDPVPDPDRGDPPACDGIVVIGGGSAIDTAKAASASSGAAARLGADHVLRRRVDGVLRHPRSRPAPARRWCGRQARRPLSTSRS